MIFPSLTNRVNVMAGLDWHQASCFTIHPTSEKSHLCAEWANFPCVTRGYPLAAPAVWLFKAISEQAESHITCLKWYVQRNWRSITIRWSNDFRSLNHTIARHSPQSKCSICTMWPWWRLRPDWLQRINGAVYVSSRLRHPIAHRFM